MKALDVLILLRQHGASVRLDDGALHLSAPWALPESALAKVRDAKPALIALLSIRPDFLDRFDDFEERAALMQCGAHLTREKAERFAWIDVFGSEFDEMAA